MNDTAFIVHLMRTETDALGFIPSTAIKTRWIPTGRYIIQRNRTGRRVGYLLHGPLHQGKPLHVNQVCIDIDDRLCTYAAQAVTELIKRARTVRATEIRLRCALDLPANQFWTAMGFIPQTVTDGGRRRKRKIVHYTLPIAHDETRRTVLTLS